MKGEIFKKKRRLTKFLACFLSLALFFSTQVSSMAIENIAAETILIDGIQHSFFREETDEQITTLLIGPEKTYQGVFNKSTSTLAVYMFDDPFTEYSLPFSSKEPLFEILIDLDSSSAISPIEPQASNVDYFSCRFFLDTIEPVFYYMKYDDDSYSLHVRGREYIRTVANTPSAVASRCEAFKTDAVQADNYFDSAVSSSANNALGIFCPVRSFIANVAGVSINAYLGTATAADWAGVLISGVSAIPGLSSFGTVYALADVSAKWSLHWASIANTYSDFNYVLAHC